MEISTPFFGAFNKQLSEFRRSCAGFLSKFLASDFSRGDVKTQSICISEVEAFQWPIETNRKDYQERSNLYVVSCSSIPVLLFSLCLTLRVFPLITPLFSRFILLA